MNINSEHISLIEMIAKNYVVRFKESRPYRSDLGVCKVQAVIIDEANLPEILLLQQGSDNPEFYLLNELRMTPSA